jgi:hypothetical protein
MYDGAELGKAIAANPGDVEAALIAYEKDLFSGEVSVLGRTTAQTAHGWSAILWRRKRDSKYLSPLIL